MGFVNKIMLMGNLTRDPELRQLPSGTAVCDFGMATNRIYKTAGGEEKQETVFVDCTAFGRTAEVIAEYCPKGRALFVEGRLHFETWEDKNGSRRSKLSVIVEQFQFVGSRDGGEGPAAESTAAQQRELPLGESRGSGRRGEEHGSTRGAAPAAGKGAQRTGKERSAEQNHEPAGTGHGPNRARGASKSRHGAAVVDRDSSDAQDVDDVDLPF